MSIIATVVLFILLGLILILPATVRIVEENLEFFLFCVGLAAGAVTGVIWRPEVWIEALREPIMIHGVPIGIFQVVLIAGLIAYFLRHRFEILILKIMKSRHAYLLLGLLTFILGMLSSVISVIVASVLLSEVALLLRIERKYKVLYCIYSCYALGVGAVLTPVGEPLATIIVSKLKTAPYYTGPGFLFSNFWYIAIPLVVLFSVLSAYVIKKGHASAPERPVEIELETLRDVVIRALRVYIFIVALVILGTSYSILAEAYFRNLPPDIMYLIGSISAIVDNATLAAAMLAPHMPLPDVVFFVTSTIIAGGFLVPGNIPNIIVASRIKIRFREWAIHALKVGIPVFFIAYAILKLHLYVLKLHHLLMV